MHSDPACRILFCSLTYFPSQLLITLSIHQADEDVHFEILS